MKVVGCGVDSLVIGFKVSQYHNVNDFEALSEAKAKAGERQFNSKGASVTWFGVDWNILPRGASGYEWIMSNADIKICIAREAQSGRVMPELYVTFTSEFLWEKGIRQAMVEVEQWLSRWATIVGNKVSRADLCLDVAMPFPVIDLNKDMVTRAKSKVEHNEHQVSSRHVSGKATTGYSVGKGDLMARIYDKTKEIRKSGKEWFKDIWLASGWDGKQTVVRFEFQSRRGFLKEMGVDSFSDLLERLADVWRYYTHDWLKICVPGSGSNQARWQCRDYWSLVQGSFDLFGEAYGVLRYKAKNVKYEHLVKQARGCLVSACALKNSQYGLDKLTTDFKQEMDKMFSSEEFNQDIKERQAKMSTLDQPPTHMVDAALALGGRIACIEPQLLMH